MRKPLDEVTERMVAAKEEIGLALARSGLLGIDNQCFGREAPLDDEGRGWGGWAGSMRSESLWLRLRRWPPRRQTYTSAWSGCKREASASEARWEGHVFHPRA
jgi:hypothetical protein